VMYSIVRAGIKFIFEWDPQNLWRSKNWPKPKFVAQDRAKIDHKRGHTTIESHDSGRHLIQGNTRSCTTLHCLATPRTTEMRTGRTPEPNLMAYNINGARSLDFTVFQVRSNIIPSIGPGPAFEVARVGLPLL